MNQHRRLLPLLFIASIVGTLTSGCIRIESNGIGGPASLGSVSELEGDVTFSLQQHSDGHFALYGVIGGALFPSGCEDFVFTASVGDQAINTSDGGMRPNFTFPGERCVAPSFSTSMQNPLDGQDPLGDLEMVIERGASGEDRLVTELPVLSAAAQPVVLNFEADKQSSVLPSQDDGPAAVQAWDRQELLIVEIPEVAHEAREVRLVVDRLKLVDRERADATVTGVEFGNEASTGVTLETAEASPDDFVVHHLAPTLDTNTFALLEGNQVLLDVDQLSEDYGLFQIQVEIIDDLALVCPTGSSCDGRLTRLSPPVIVELAPVPEDSFCIGACG